MREGRDLIAGEPVRVNGPSERWICDAKRSPVPARKRDRDRCECAGREYKCIGCNQWKPWCDGGAPDPRCDNCVGTEVVLLEIEERAAEIVACIHAGDVEGSTLEGLELTGWKQHAIGPEFEGDIFDPDARSILAGMLAREIYES